MTKPRPLAPAALALLCAAVAPVAVHAQDATAGKALYTQHCTGCHGNPLNNQNNVLNAAGNPGVIANAIAANKGGMGALKNLLSTANLNDIAAYLANPNGDLPQAGVSAGAVDFGAVAVGSTGSGSVTLSSTSAATLTVQSIKIASGGSSPFAYSGTGACAGAGTLAGGASCKITVSFTPATAAAVTDALTIVSNSQGGAITVNLSGGSGASTPPPTSTPPPAAPPAASGGKSGGGCSVASGPQRDVSLALLGLLAVGVALRRRRNRRG
ncbi:MAG: choice-of-anchor D domain-containing protein [Betaproteobacteria bacterium]|nr:choice-of-anchor D domain-containing protein [Betaproteobacteria bacterium]MDE2048116.1 choice-of-anchor D domain-containing protein [Betaproteobacteria bacterium]